MANVCVCVVRARKPAHPLGGGRRIVMSVATNSASQKWQPGPAYCVDMLVLEPAKDKSQLLSRVFSRGGLIVPTSKWQNKIF